MMSSYLGRIPEAGPRGYKRLDKPTALYRLYSGDLLLYIGISLHPRRRWAEHQHSSAWWKDVTDATTEWYPTRAEALQAEGEAIRAELPRYNLAQNPNQSPDGLTTRQAIERRGSLVGLCFLSDAELCWSGLVLSEPAAHVYRLKRTDWWGEVSDRALVAATEMVGWQFYVSRSWMERGFESHFAKAGCPFLDTDVYA